MSGCVWVVRLCFDWLFVTHAGSRQQQAGENLPPRSFASAAACSRARVRRASFWVCQIVPTTATQYKRSVPCILHAWQMCHDTNTHAHRINCVRSNPSSSFLFCDSSDFSMKDQNTPPQEACPAIRPHNQGNDCEGPSLSLQHVVRSLTLVVWVVAAVGRWASKTMHFLRL